MTASKHVVREHGREEETNRESIAMQAEREFPHKQAGARGRSSLFRIVCPDAESFWNRRRKWSRPWVHVRCGFTASSKLSGGGGGKKAVEQEESKGPKAQGKRAMICHDLRQSKGKDSAERESRLVKGVIRITTVIRIPRGDTSQLGTSRADSSFPNRRRARCGPTGREVGMSEYVGKGSTREKSVSQVKVDKARNANGYPGEQVVEVHLFARKGDEPENSLDGADVSESIGTPFGPSLEWTEGRALQKYYSREVPLSVNGSSWHLRVRALSREINGLGGGKVGTFGMRKVVDWRRKRGLDRKEAASSPEGEALGVRGVAWRRRQAAWREAVEVFSSGVRLERIFRNEQQLNAVAAEATSGKMGGAAKQTGKGRQKERPGVSGRYRSQLSEHGTCGAFAVRVRVRPRKVVAEHREGGRLGAKSRQRLPVSAAVRAKSGVTATTLNERACTAAGKQYAGTVHERAQAYDIVVPAHAAAAGREDAALGHRTKPYAGALGRHLGPAVPADKRDQQRARAGAQGINAAAAERKGIGPVAAHEAGCRRAWGYVTCWRQMTPRKEGKVKQSCGNGPRSNAFRGVGAKGKEPEPARPVLSGSISCRAGRGDRPKIGEGEGKKWGVEVVYAQIGEKGPR
ncbi:hypothetical protein B0H17DRAFT_1185236 [Mycena rosella]|uniref:Uncharacterized protein n=1 Tax=Mycena rosella TaxID=1033263 RepID=A0AAD7G2M7_MYCRO|nr:hypothetical protein B0H17DRAFT_1185236 [Mycena rosella]